MSNHSESAFNVIGISVRTNNNVGGRDIGNLWEKFMGEGIFGKIPNKTSYDVYGILPIMNPTIRAIILPSWDAL